jgi:hypothetical protein
MPSEIRRFKFTVSWLCEDHTAADIHVKLLITNYAFFIVQRATAQSKTGTFRDDGVAEAPPGFQAGWSDCMYFLSLFLFISFAHMVLMQPRHSSQEDDKTTKHFERLNQHTFF